jgi:hypothetical protein
MHPRRESIGKNDQSQRKDTMKENTEPMIGAFRLVGGLLLYNSPYAIGAKKV